MRSIYFVSYIALFSVCSFFVFHSLGSAQTSDSLHVNASHKILFSVSLSDSTTQLPNQFIVQGTDSVWLDSLRLQVNVDYLLDYRSGKLSLKWEKLKYKFPDSTQHKLIVQYQAFPFSFQPQYRHREAVMKIDSTTKGERKISKPVRPFSMDELFGSNLQKSGSIVRGLSIGSNRDLTLNSGFRMQMSGNISDNVAVIAALTDENTPIQPEGTTQTLQEIDKVFVEIRGPDIGATLGDFNLNLIGGEFAHLSRKLQGAKGLANYRTSFVNGDFMVSGATSRGKFTSNQIQGIDGVQGPYRLTGKNGERDIVVIAGTEHVYVNGETMTRGELNDYTIDYSNAEIVFVTRRLISAASRITVDFEYTDRQFTRNLFTMQSNNSFWHDKFRFNATYFQENDDKDSPIETDLSDSDKTILGDAGNSRLKAQRSGIDSVGPGKGQYVRIDTLVYSPDSLKNILFTIYRFAPEDTVNAQYLISFTLLGQGNGDYSKSAPGRFQFVGIRQGSYAPIRLLPVPQTHSLTDFGFTVQPTSDFNVTGEYALSNYDANRFSNLDNANNSGSAVKFGIVYSTKNISIGKTNVGSLSISFNERYVNKRFVAIDRLNEIEYNRKWNLDDLSSSDEELREGTIMYQPIQSLVVNGGIGLLKREANFSSNRFTSGLHFNDGHLPKIDYDFEAITSDNNQSKSSSNWTRQHGTTEYHVGAFTPGFRYEGEERREKNTATDTLNSGSFRFNEFGPRVNINDAGLLSFNSEVTWRTDDSLLNRNLLRASLTTTQQYGLQLKEWHSFSSSLDLSIRNRSFTNEFTKRNNVDVKTILVRSQTRYSPFNRGIESDMFYEVASSRTAKLQRVFQQVPVGTGNYVYAGDVNGNYIVDEPDFQPARFDGNYIVISVPSEQFTPVTDVKASARIRLNGSRLFLGESSIHKILSTLSTETYARIEEKSSEPDSKQIYLLRLSKFLNDSTTLEGSSLFSQDVYVFENNPLFSLRLRFLQRLGLSQFTLQNERTYARERSIRVRWSLIKEFSNQTDYIQKVDNLGSTLAISRVRGIFSDNFITDWSYRPQQQIELGFKIGVGRATNFDSTVANMNDQSVRLSYSFEGQGQAKAELTREEARVNKSTVLQPFELTGGKVIGRTWLWRLGLDYRVTQYVQATLNYDGRSENGGQAIHSGRAEVRAFF